MSSRVDSIQVSADTLRIFFNDNLANSPFRSVEIGKLYSTVAKLVRSRYSRMEIWSRGTEVSALEPNLYRPKDQIDVARLPRARVSVDSDRAAADGLPIQQTPLTQNLDQPWLNQSLLSGRHIAMWPSHGWYYEPSLDRWEWQRARLFQAVEDKLPLAFTLQYLVPMLENAGADVLLPRERDTQTNEVVVDNDDVAQDSTSLKSQYAELSYDLPIRTAIPGFNNPTNPLVNGENPFAAGTFRILPPADSTTASVQWIPNVPAPGRYAVYVSFGDATAQRLDCVPNAEYIVNHSGGETRFEVNQCMSFATWVYLGHFDFSQGRNSANASVTLTNKNSSGNLRVTADAVRFGGGMGSVERGGRVSGRPRYVEAARYYLQYAGISDSLVYDVWGSGDYIDDYRSRGEWVNYLVGAPFGPNKNRNASGLNVPVDLSLAFHTDAGMAQSDTTIGTLLIYSTTGMEGERVFPDGVSRLANRDLADILQTEIVNDMRRVADREWPRRPLWDRDYSEAVRPNVPSALLELLAHQNFTDMKFALDPRFRFLISRSIYKGLARFLAFQNGEEFVAQPLPVDDFSAVLKGASVHLAWSAVADSLEATATPDAFIVYKRVGQAGWNNGQLFPVSHATLPAPPAGEIHSYMIRALNKGGVSFPSEILAVGVAPESRGSVLVVNAFDRIAGPESFSEGNIAGFPEWLDHGVADGIDIAQTGAQYRFQKTDPWRDDDAPGFGASYGSYETTIVKGNSFDFSIVHGQSILAAGYSFSSVSDESFWRGRSEGVDASYWSSFLILDILLGEEKLTPWPKGVSDPQFEAFPIEFRDAIDQFTSNGRGVFLSGAYVGSELSSDSLDYDYSEKIFGFVHRTDHAVLDGTVEPGIDWKDLKPFRFSTSDHSGPYAVEAPDAIRSVEGSQVFLRYAENNMGAGIVRLGERATVVLAFPFETIETREARDSVMKFVLDALVRNDANN